jgi:hypothetical protein
LRRILDISPAIEAQIDGLIKRKGYRDFNHFALVALENQITWEESKVAEAPVSPLRGEPYPGEGQLFSQLSIKREGKTRLKSLEPPEGSKKVLWGQYYRFLPVKLAVRVLHTMCNDEFPDVRDFIEKVRDAALPLRHQLVRLDRMDRRLFGDLLSASFPAYDEKSVRRFINQYIIYVRSSDLHLMGMTRFGIQFAELQNPVLDMNKPESLSKEEINFLLNHIADELPEEFEHILIALNAINEGKCTRESLNFTLKNYYLRYHEGVNWSDSVVNTMRSGLLSRLNEMGLIRREKRGKNIRYHVTQTGENYIRNLSDREPINAEYFGENKK